MKKKWIIFITVLVAGVLSACGNKQLTDQGAGAGNEKTNNMKGPITMAGSTSMEKLANTAAEAFMEKYPKVSLSPEFIGSSAGVAAVIEGTVEIGNASRYLKDSEKNSGVVENIIAIDGIAVIVDKGNTVTGITLDQLINIYTGMITNWSELGGANQPIVVIGREAGSGTRGAFEEILKVEDKCSYSNEINSTGGVIAKVTSTPGAIGYVSIDIIDDTVSTLNIDQVAPTEENIKAKSYLLSRPFVMATKGEISEQKEVVQAFFDYMSSEEGKALIRSVGLITVD